MVTVICIYAKEASYVRKYLKSIKNRDIINYMDISSKLTKNDIYAHEPSSFIINSYIIRMLEKYLEETTNGTLYYIMSSLEADTIHNLRSHIENICGKEHLRFTAKIRNKVDYKNIFFLFDLIEELEV